MDFLNAYTDEIQNVMFFHGSTWLLEQDEALSNKNLEKLLEK